MMYNLCRTKLIYRIGNSFLILVTGKYFPSKIPCTLKYDFVKKLHRMR